MSMTALGPAARSTCASWYPQLAMAGKLSLRFASLYYVMLVVIKTGCLCA